MSDLWLWLVFALLLLALVLGATRWDWLKLWWMDRLASSNIPPETGGHPDSPRKVPRRQAEPSHPVPHRKPEIHRSGHRH